LRQAAMLPPLSNEMATATFRVSDAWHKYKLP
jgi:hypothetical protein